MNDDERIAKLPKWAQRRIEKLEGDLEHKSAKLQAGPENSNTFADPYIDRRPLGWRARIRFDLGDGNHVDAEIKGPEEEPYVELIGQRGRLRVRPHSGNVIDVRPEGHY